MSTTHAPDIKQRQGPSLGVIFLTIFIDLVGFSIIFPLFPAILDHYLAKDGDSGLLLWMIEQIETISALAGDKERYTPVLFGGILGSLYASLQFVFAPIWGSLSDAKGRRPILLLTTVGTALSYAAWMFAGSFGMLVAARLVSGAMSGNLSVATAAVADVTTEKNRAKGMGLVGVAFGLGFVLGPAIGGMCSQWDWLAGQPEWAKFGINPFSSVAAIAAGLSIINLIWIASRFKESLPEETRNKAQFSRNPITRLLAPQSASIRKTNLVYLVYILAFSGMEFTLVFLGADRFGFGVKAITIMMIYIGFILILTQGGIVRRMAPKLGEVKTASIGLFLVSIGLAVLAIAPSPTILYLGLFFMALGSGLCSPTLTALVSRYASKNDQGKALGTFRSIGSLGRAIGPILASLVFWLFSSSALYLAGAAIVFVSFLLCVKLPKPSSDA